MDKRHEELFNKYGIFYEMADDNETVHTRVARQKEIYEKMLKKGLKKTEVPSLINMISEEIQCQYHRKESTENRAGFLLALWGILLGILCSDNSIIVKGKALFLISGIWLQILLLLLLLIGIILGILSVFYVCKCIKYKFYHAYEFSDRENNYKCAVDDRKLFNVIMLEGLHNVWDENNKANIAAGKYFNFGLWTLVGFLAVIAVSALIIFLV